MSMISEFVEKLREKAAIFSRSDFAVAGIAKDYKDCADIIEELSEKLSSENIEKSENYCDDLIVRLNCRCKDCKYWSDEVAGATENIKLCTIGHYMTGKGGYCLYSEPKA